MDKNALIKSIETNNLTPAQIEEINTSVRLQMASSLVESVKQMDVMQSSIAGVIDRLRKFTVEQIDASIQSGTLTPEDAINHLSKLFNMQVAAAEVKRKIFNGREMFNINPLSEREVALMELLKKIDTNEKRDKLEAFIDSIVEENGSEFEELP